MKMKILLLLGALFFTPLSAKEPKGYPNWFTGEGYTTMNIAPCKQCGFRATNPQTLKRHIYSQHTTKVPLFVKCNYVGCDKRFRSNKRLMWHIDRGDHDIKEEQLHKRCGCRR